MIYGYMPLCSIWFSKISVKKSEFVYGLVNRVSNLVKSRNELEVGSE